MAKNKYKELKSDVKDKLNEILIMLKGVSEYVDGRFVTEDYNRVNPLDKYFDISEYCEDDEEGNSSGNEDLKKAVKNLDKDELFLSALKSYCKRVVKSDAEAVENENQYYNSNCF